jgi:tRNA(fMet)-specific endonuclease VapC
MTYLLDTNTCVSHLRATHRALSRKIQDHLPGDVAICSVVKAELLYGALHGMNSDENTVKLEEFFALFQSLPFGDEAAYEYGQLRSALAAKGTPIGPNDLLIASIAKAHNLVLVTHNTAEFRRVPGLHLEDWTD